MKQVRPVKKKRKKQNKKSNLSSPNTTSVIFLMSMPGSFLTLHWYVAVSETVTPVIEIEASPWSGFPVKLNLLETLLSV